MRNVLTRSVAVAALALAPIVVLAQGAQNPGNGPGARGEAPKMGREGNKRDQGGAMQQGDRGDKRDENRKADRGERGDRMDRRGADAGPGRGPDDDRRAGEMRRDDKDHGDKDRDVGDRGMRRRPVRVVTTEERTRIRENVFKIRDVERLRNVDFAVSVGTAVPARYAFRPLPPEIISFVPEYEGYDYIVVGDQILILDPVTRNIVAIIS